MRILIDTNVLIAREDNHVLPEELQGLERLLAEAQIEIFIHPASIQDIQHDKDFTRQEIILSKLKSYRELETPPKPSQEFLEIVGSKKVPNDEIDNHILFCIYKNAVSYLFTEDQGIIRKAQRIGVSNRVFTISEALQFFTKLLKKPIKIPRLSFLQHIPVHNLEISDPIFDSLREDYPETPNAMSFNQWFEKIARQGRKAFVYQQKNASLGAVCIYKLEEEPVVDCYPPLPAKPRLKLCTVKVSHTGYKIGELFIKLAIQMSIGNNRTEIYLTHFIKPKDSLMDLIEEYGFIQVATKTNGEVVFLKSLFPDLQALPKHFDALTIAELNQRYFPSFYDGEAVNKFLVPILPHYHDQLFPELNQIPSLNGHLKIIHAEGNTIKKAYLCNAPIRQMRKNDLVLFYRSHRAQAITAVGTVDEVYADVQDPQETLSLVIKRTVYSLREIEKLSTKPLLIILFRLNFFLRNPVTLSQMREHSIGIPITITPLNQKNYIVVKQLGQVDGRFTFH